MSEDETQSSDLPLPSTEDIKKEIGSSGKQLRGNEDEFLRQFNTFSVQSERSYTHLKALQDHYQHKSMWSYFIGSLMLFMVLFQSFLLFMVGIGEWSFEKYVWLLPALLVQNLAQIAGLALFVVRALFKEINSE
jgi:hypothetical protein